VDIELLERKISADFIKNNLNRKMRNRPKNSPWISSLRGIDPKGLKWEHERAQKHRFRLNLRVFTGVYGIWTDHACVDNYGWITYHIGYRFERD
jgi:hypothetical protein